jgi:hypothetical protein
MDDSERFEEYTLIKVSKDYATLELEDRSQWSIAPIAMPTSGTWVPTMATIRVKLIAPKSLWPYELTNMENDTSVRARLVSKKRSRKKI